MPMQLIRNLEDTVDRQAVASRSEGYVGRFSPQEREKLKDGSYDYMGLTRDYYDLVTSFYEYGWGESFHFVPPSPGSTTTQPRLGRRGQNRRPLPKPGASSNPGGCSHPTTGA